MIAMDIQVVVMLSWLCSPKIWFRYVASLTPPCAILFATIGNLDPKYLSVFIEIQIQIHLDKLC
jgi:hypothetical protein